MLYTSQKFHHHKLSSFPVKGVFGESILHKRSVGRYVLASHTTLRLGCPSKEQGLLMYCNGLNAPGTIYAIYQIQLEPSNLCNRYTKYVWMSPTLPVAPLRPIFYYPGPFNSCSGRRVSYSCRQKSLFPSFTQASQPIHVIVFWVLGFMKPTPIVSYDWKSIHWRSYSSPSLLHFRQDRVQDVLRHIIHGVILN